MFAIGDSVMVGAAGKGSGVAAVAPDEAAPNCGRNTEAGVDTRLELAGVVCAVCVVCVVCESKVRADRTIAAASGVAASAVPEPTGPVSAVPAGMVVVAESTVVGACPGGVEAPVAGGSSATPPGGKVEPAGWTGVDGARPAATGVAPNRGPAGGTPVTPEPETPAAADGGTGSAGAGGPTGWAVSWAGIPICDRAAAAT